MSTSPEVMNAAYVPSKPRIFTSTFVSELSVGLHVGGVGSLLLLLATDMGIPVDSFAILGSFLGMGMFINAATSQWWMPKLTAGTVFRICSGMNITGGLLLALAPYYWLVIFGGALVGLGSALVILLAPITLAGPRAARDLALANGASSAASIAAPLFYGMVASIPGAQGRWAALILLLPPLYVLSVVRHIDWIETPSAYAERWAGRKARKRRKDFSDTFGPVPSVAAFGGATEVKDTERGRATAAGPTTAIHIPDITQPLGETEEASEGVVAMHEAIEASPAISEVPSAFVDLETKDALAHQAPPAEAASIGLIISCLARIAISLIPEFAITTWGAFRLTEVGLDAASAAALAAAMPVGLATGRLGAALFIRIPRVFEISLGISLLGCVMISLAPNLAVAVTGMFICGIGTALLYPITIDDLSKLPGLPTRKAAALGTLIGGATIFVVPLLLQLIGAHLSIGLALLSITPIYVIMLLLPKKARRDPLKLLKQD